MIAERRPIDPEAKNMWRIAGTTGAVGIEVAVAISLGYFGGQWLDRKFGTAPWLAIAGFVAGIGAAIKALVRVTREYRKNLAQDLKQDPKPEQDRTPKNAPPNEQNTPEDTPHNHNAR